MKLRDVMFDEMATFEASRFEGDGEKVVEDLFLRIYRDVQEGSGFM